MIKNDIPKLLIDAFSNNKLVLFVGSGLSIDLGLPSWNQLVIDIIDHIEKETGTTNLSLFKQLLSANDMDALDVLTQIEKKGHKKIVQDYIGNNLRLKDDCDLSIHKKLIKLCPKIVTTNYDHAFEQASGDSAHKISNNSQHGISNLSNKKEYIFKIHGDIDEPDYCILFESDYEKLYQQNSQQQDLFTSQFKNIILNKTLLFVGFSLGDPYVKKIMDHINNITKGTMSKHFLFTTNEAFDLPYIQPLILKNYSDLNDVLDNIAQKINSVPQENIIKDIETLDIEIKKEPKTSLVNLLFSHPVDKDYSHNIDLFSRAFSKYKLRLNISYLNLEQIRNIENGLIIMFSNVVKNKLIIEDEYLQSRQINHSELIDNLSNDLNGVIIFANDVPDIDTKESSAIACAYIVEENPAKIKRKLDSILYKLLNKKRDFLNSEDVRIGSANFKTFDFKKGNIIKVNREVKVSKYLDKKLLTNFVGRKTDVENIIRKIIDLEFESKILIIKSILELAERQIFDSIQYISCQSIASYENFEYQLANCLNIDSSANVIEQIQSNKPESKTVIILDNFETLLQLEEKNQILNLVSDVCNNYIIVTTSRQLLDLDFEEVYELRNLTTDEGVQLFKKYFKGNLETKEEDILRYEIIEDLLNNNPLAIKIISKGIPNSKDLELLKNELKENIFKNENINKIFENPEDINIEKSSSLFYSIKYGFDKLNDREKFAFELLSLFPDGIHVENLKKFAKQNKDSIKITDKEIKSLDDKSLLENSRGFLKLQSIINRFSSFQFKQRSEETRIKYYTLCFDYNFFFLNVMDEIFSTSNSIQIHEDNINNYLKCIDFIEFVDKPNSEKLDYIDSLALFFRHINQYHEFLEIVGQEKIRNLFIEDEKEKKLFNLIILQLIYWCKDFSVVDNIRETYSRNELINLDFNNKIEKLSYFKILNVLTCEGESLFSIKDTIDRWFLDNSIVDDIYRIGLIEIASNLVKFESEKTFIEYDILYESGQLDSNSLDEYISKLHDKESLELVQISYVKLKLDPTAKIETSNFIITNPYSKGMIALIKALSNKEIESKNRYFKKAIKNLKNIKYYYVESIYQYCKFLESENNQEDFQKYFKIGIENSVKFNFWYLKFKFENLSDQSLVYDENLTFNKIEGIERPTFDLFIEQYKNERKSTRKKQ